MGAFVDDGPAGCSRVRRLAGSSTVAYEERFPAWDLINYTELTSGLQCEKRYIQCFLVMERVGTAYRHLFQVMKNKIITILLYK